MTVLLAAAGEIRIGGDCPVEEAPVLQQLLLQHPAAAVDWTRCRHAHAAIVQLLFIAGRPLRGPSASPFLREWIEPLLQPPGFPADDGSATLAVCQGSTQRCPATAPDNAGERKEGGP